MDDFDRILLREESESLLNDEIMGKAAKTMLELLDELDKKDKEIERLKSEE